MIRRDNHSTQTKSSASTTLSPQTPYTPQKREGDREVEREKQRLAWD
jgi:hypothetical protein